MARQQRKKMIKRIAEARNSEVICYITGDRENVSTRIAPDVIEVFYRHLELIGSCKMLDLFIYTRGGDIITPWRLVQLAREYTPRFCVLVPFRCYSAGTLLCLGADEIVMGKMGELGPIDPSVVNPFNPQDQNNPIAKIPLNIEDVYSFLALGEEKAGVCNGEQMVKIFTILSERIHPLALGTVHRNYLLIRSLAKKLLAAHQEPAGKDKVEVIIDNLTEKLYAHNYIISRREAMNEISLPVTIPDNTLESLLWGVYRSYVEEMSLSEPFNPIEQLMGTRREFEVTSGYVESLHGSDAFVFSGVIDRKDYPDSDSANVCILKQGWRIVS